MMENEKILEALLNLLEKMSIEVRYDRGNFNGGLVKYRDEDIFYLNRKTDVDVKINTIINELKNLEIPKEYITDELEPVFDTQTKNEE